MIHFSYHMNNVIITLHIYMETIYKITGQIAMNVLILEKNFSKLKRKRLSRLK
jgi:hypothetical protein